MKNRFISALALTLCVMSSSVMADTATEVREVILDHIAHINLELIVIFPAFAQLF